MLYKNGDIGGINYPELFTTVKFISIFVTFS